MSLSAKQKLRQPFHLQENDKRKNYECFSVADEAYDVSGAKCTQLEQERWRPHAIALCVVSLATTLGLAIVGFVYSLKVGNDALFGFGATCVLDFLSTAFVLWRFIPSNRGTSAAYELELERIASLRIAILFVVAFCVILGKCVYHLVLKEAPRSDHNIVIISYVSLAVCLILGVAKLALANRLLSSSMRTDGVNSLAGAVIASGAVISYYVYRAQPNIWYISAIFGLAIALCLLLLGVRAILRLRKQRPSDEFVY